jgi:hypothetical protein
MIAVGAFVLFATASSIPASPLAPVGKWIVEGKDNTCVLSHAYGDPAVTIGLRPWPIGDRADLILVTPGSGQDFDTGTVSLMLGNASKAINAHYIGYAIKGRKQHLIDVSLPNHSLKEIESSSAITYSVDGSAPVTFAPPDRARAYAVLDDCLGLLRRALHIDPMILADMVAPPQAKGQPSAWFDNSYPDAAVTAGAQGATSALLTINTKGRVIDCVPFGSSGVPALDERTCAQFKRAAYFHPALGKDGKPVIGYNVQVVNWRILSGGF